jgi:hypothetical protein
VKRMSFIGLVVIAGFVILGGTLASTPAVLSAGYQIAADSAGNPGGAIDISWESPYSSQGTGCYGVDYDSPKPDSFLVSIDGQPYATDSTRYTVYTPCRIIEIYAVYGETKSDPVTLDLRMVETESVEIYSLEDPDYEHNSGLGFLDDGSALTYNLGFAADHPDVDYYLDTNLVLSSPHLFQPDPINDEHNRVSVEDSAFAALDMLKAAGEENFSTAQELEQDGVYGLWIDPSGDGYDEDDFFAKLQVTGIDGFKVTLNLAFQPKSGLRWVVTE